MCRSPCEITSFRLDARLLHHCAPARRLPAHERVEVCRRPHRDASGDEIDHRRATAAIRHVHQIRGSRSCSGAACSRPAPICRPARPQSCGSRTRGQSTRLQQARPAKREQRCGDLYGKVAIQRTSASTTAFGCSGISAWLASGTTITVTREPNSSFISLRLDSGLNGSFAA